METMDEDTNDTISHRIPVDYAAFGRVLRR